MKFLYAAVLAFAVGVFAMPAPQGENALMERSHPTTSSKKSTATSSTKKSTKTSTKAKTSSTKVAVVTATPTKVSSGSGSSGAGLPRSSGTSVLKAAQTIAAGGSFDGKMVAFDRGQSCTGQAEGGDKDAVFIIEAGGSLSNVIIGPNQIEGVHCMGACKLTNVWWSAVCEDAFTIKEQSASQKTTITGGGAFGAEDKVLQHNGGGTLQVAGFTVGDFGKLYRSCGNCKSMPARHVILSDITAKSGKSLVGINPNKGDTATLSGIKVSGVKEICVTYTGTSPGNEPKKVGSGVGTAGCDYSASDVTEI